MTAMSLGPQITQAIRCTFPKCTCECFSSTKAQIRTCQSCKHGWVAHAIDKLISSNPFAVLGQVEPISPSVVFDIASLVLYGCQAIPIRLKVALDRLFSALQHEEVLQILHGFGWSYEDYARGYILQDPNGRVLEKYCIIAREEEGVVLQQFTRFAETRNITQELMVQESKQTQDLNQSPHMNQAKSDSDIRKFIERNNMSLIQSYNLALRRAFDSSPQSLLTAMGAAFPPHLNLAAAAAQFGRGFPGAAGMMPMPPVGFPPHTVEPKPEPVTPSEQHRRASEPYDLSKRSPESHSKSCSPASSAGGINQSSTLNNNTALPQPRPDRLSGLSDHAISDLSSSLTMRKVSSPSSPMKRTPSSPPGSKQGWPFNNPAFGQTVFVTSSGKKRVLCTACNKTFCDKGALKIHYSAVHLKEMHKCSIPGCNMMFSSRRSRNRHSANPNPKLHTPQTRRPRERYDSAQDHMMAMMAGMTGAPKNGGDDCGSSIDENDMMSSTQDMTSQGPQGDGDYRQMGEKSGAPSDDEMEGIDGDDYSTADTGAADDDDEELPTQVKIRQDSPLYRNNKRKRLMPTRVASFMDAGDDVRSRGAGSALQEPAEEPLNVDDSQDPPVLGNDMFVSEAREPGEVRTRSPAELGEVIRKEHNSNGEGDVDNKLNFVPKFSLPSTDKQVSAMHSLFSSFLPPNTEGQGSAFWSKFIQQTAAAAAAHKANQELIVDNSESESTTSDKREEEQYQCKVDSSGASFNNQESRDIHSDNVKLQTQKFETKLENGSGESNRALGCLFCDKSFPTDDALSKHIQAVHRGQESLYSEQTYSTQLEDSMKSKTPVIA